LVLQRNRISVIINQKIQFIMMPLIGLVKIAKKRKAFKKTSAFYKKLAQCIRTQYMNIGPERKL